MFTQISAFDDAGGLATNIEKALKIIWFNLLIISIVII